MHNIETVYGFHVINNLLKNKPQHLLQINIFRKKINKRLQNLIQEIKKLNIPIKKYDQKTFNKKYQGISAKIKIIHNKKKDNVLEIILQHKKPLILILDCITDPRNLGSCIRCANYFGVHLIIIPRNKSAKINSTVKKTSCGTTDTIPIVYVANLINTINILKKHNINIVGTAINTTKKNILYNTNFSLPLAIILGSENKGIRNLIKKNCDQLINIPQHGSTISSLNVSVAAGILLFEIMRQKNNQNKKTIKIKK